MSSGVAAIAMAIVTLFGAGSVALAQPAEVECQPHALPGEVHCHALAVPENPDLEGGRQIELQIMVLRAYSPDPEPDPLIVLTGGPGQSALAQRGLPDFFAEFLDPVRRDRDIILFDQRGTGGSNPIRFDPPPQLLFDELGAVIPSSWGEDAAAQFQNRADLTQYTTQRMVEDIDRIRTAFGADQVNLFGTSYGTRVAALYVRQFEPHTRTVIMKGVMAHDDVIPMVYGYPTQRALDDLLNQCAQEQSCAEQHPRLGSQFEQVMQRLRLAPAEVQVEHPLTGETGPVAIDEGAFALVLRTLMSSASDRGAVPGIIEAAAAEDWEPVAGLVVRIRSAYSQILWSGVTASVVAAEDLHRIDREAVETMAASTFMRGHAARAMIALAEQIPASSASQDQFAPLRSQTPIFLISGDLDPTTPPSGADRLALTLPNSHHAVFVGGSHSAANFVGLSDLMAAFVEAGSIDVLGGPGRFEYGALLPLVEAEAAE